MSSTNPAAGTTDQDNCPLCGSGRPRRLECEFPGILQCPSCSFVYAERSVHGEDSELYEETFADTNRHPTYRKENGRYIIRNEAKLNRLLDELEPFRKTGKLLDVGCSAAFFLQLAADRGWLCKGVDVSAWATRFSVEQLGLDVVHGTLQDARLPSEEFDVVFSSHVMEHIARPLDMFREMARVLRPGGALVTVVPTQFSSPMWRLRRVLTGDPPPWHRAFYTRDTISQFLRKADCTPVSTTYNVEVSRLPQLFRSPERNLKGFRRLQSSEPGADEKMTRLQESTAGRITKKLVNLIGSIFGMGDELVSLAVKNERPTLAPAEAEDKRRVA